MAYRIDKFAPGEIYHIFTRGVEKRKIFLDNNDRNRFIKLLTHCMPTTSIRSYSLATRTKKPKEVYIQEGEGLVDLLCYCLMPNHFHLLLRENVERGTSTFMQRLLTSYSRYFNVRRNRSGSLFIHPFKAVLVDADDQLLHVSRYIYINPYVAHLHDDPFTYSWSSLPEYSGSMSKKICHDSLLRSMLPSQREFNEFISDYASYAQSIADFHNVLVDFDG